MFRFFECNYGTSGYPMDKIFGTFRDKLKDSGTSYKGGSEEKTDVKSAAIHDRKASLTSMSFHKCFCLVTRKNFLYRSS